MTRWTLHDPETDETWTMPVNPDSMSPIGKQRALSFGQGTPADPRTRVAMVPAVARDFEWGGVIRSKAHYDALEEWSRKPGAVEVTDHLGRQFVVAIEAFKPTDRKPTKRITWRLRYVMTAKLLEGPQ